MDAPDQDTGSDPVGGLTVPASAVRSIRAGWGRFPLRIHPAWVFIIIAIGVLWRVAMASGLNTDVFWALASGQWMLAHHRVIHQDLYSYTIRGHNWVAEEWGFEVALAWLVRTIGPFTYWAVSAGACSVALLAGVARWRRLGAGWLWVSALALVAALPLAFGVAPRPQDASYAFFAIELLVLTLGRQRRGWLCALPPLMALWANVHGSFLLGLGILGLEVLWSLMPSGRGRIRVVEGLPRRAAVATLVAGTAGALVNPRGFGLFSYAAHVSTAPQLTSMIAEWQSPDFHSLLMLALVIGPAIVLVAVLGRRSESPVALEDLAIWGILFLATLHAVRFLPYLGIAWCGVAARWKPIRRESIRPTIWTWPLAAVIGLAALSGAHPGPAAIQKGIPVAAGRFLARQSGRVFSTYAWNDYLIRAGIPVFVDGRTDMYFGTGILGQYQRVADLEGNPDVILDRWDVRWVLWNPGSALAVFLAHDPVWRVAHRFGDSVVFERVSESGTLA